MGKYIIRETNGRYTFRLRADNNEIIGVSQLYADLSSCKVGIASVAANAPVAAIEDQTVDGYAVQKHPKFEIYTDKAGETRFRLVARNGENILASEGYTAKASAKNGIDAVRRNADSPTELDT